MLRVENLYHSYANNENHSVRDVSFHVAEGEVFGFLGPSGAGKSTTRNLITGLLPLQKGRVAVAGHDIAKPHLKTGDEPAGQVPAIMINGLVNELVEGTP